MAVGMMLLSGSAGHGLAPGTLNDWLVVGLLLLLVGYFAPLPPRREAVDVSAQQASAA